MDKILNESRIRPSQGSIDIQVKNKEKTHTGPSEGTASPSHVNSAMNSKPVSPKKGPGGTAVAP